MGISMASKRIRLTCMFCELLILLLCITSYGYTRNTSRLHQEITTKSPEAQIFYDQGLTHLYNYEWQKAFEAFQKAIQHDPNCAMAYFGLMRARALAGWLPTEVNELLKKSSDLASDEREQSYISAYRALLNRKVDEATSIVKKLIMKFPYEQKTKEILNRAILLSERWGQKEYIER